MLTPSATPRHNLSYCATKVRTYDHDRFLCALFAPEDLREDLFALYAFHLEIAKTREVVSEPLLGQIRLQWWREAIAAIYDGGAPRRHAVLEPLATAISRHHLSRDYFDRMIDGRETDLADQPPATLEALVEYAEATAVPLINLSLEILNAATPSALAAARHAGIAVALAGLLRAVPFHARAQRLYLPADLLAAHHVRISDVFAGKADAGLSAIIKTVANRAWKAIATARALRKTTPRAALPALLPVTLASLGLKSIERAGYNPFHQRTDPPHPLRLALMAIIGRY